MSEIPAIGRDEALRLHRAGDLAAARAAYEALATTDPADADVVGLLGIVALQQNRPGDAEHLLRQALGCAATDPAIAVRNLNSLLVLLQQAGRKDEAAALLADGLPEWPEGRVPDAAERGAVLSLVEAALLLDKPGQGWRLLSRALPWQSAPGRAEDTQVQGLAGRLQLALGHPGAALVPLQRAAVGAPDDIPVLMALFTAEQKAGQDKRAKAVMRRIYQVGRIYSAPPHRAHKASILLLNQLPDTPKNVQAGLAGLHFHGSYASEIQSVMREEYRFHSLLCDLPHAEVPTNLPAADLVLNNIVNSEGLNVPGRLEALSAAVRRIGLPVINPPEQVHATTRQKNALLLKDVPNLKVPRIERYHSGRASPEAIAASIGENVGLPVILRRTGAHESTDSLLVEGYDKAAVLLRGKDELLDHLRNSGWGEFYAIEYIDLRRPDGHFRKVRAVFMGGEVIVTSSAMYSDWRVSGWRRKPQGIAFYRAHPEVTEECRAIARNPEAVLGREALLTLDAIRDRIPLDMFGVDFEVDAEGRVVFFEATAAMIFRGNYNRVAADIALPPEPFLRVDDAFRALVARRIAESAPREPRRLQ